MFMTLLVVGQFIFTVIMCVYFSKALKEKSTESLKLKRSDERELARLRQMKQIKLSLPLSEKTRPSGLNEVIGQEKGIRALKAALCGPNPQHVIIYGSPGVGKTAAARLMLEEAKKQPCSPFDNDAKFIETDATVMRFDERNIADPLIGSVHDPIYQGAGSYGPAGIPKPIPGAVTKAHGGVLFIDEIGELHPSHINKLLKVLEDRKVYLESAYYSPDDISLPLHIHEIFKEGLPADFRLIGATTRLPSEIPAAIRSRCVEIYFEDLTEDEICKIASGAAEKSGFETDENVCKIISEYAVNGRDAVNMMQTAISLCMVENRSAVTTKDIEWVIETGKYQKKYSNILSGEHKTGCASGLAVSGNKGVVIDIETDISDGEGIYLSGLIENESIESYGRKMNKTSAAKSSVANTLVVLKKEFGIDLTHKRVSINVPGGMIVDGPSAGCAIFAALYSAVKNIPISSKIAFTGEISIAGQIKAVGGVAEKLCGAISAGAEIVFVPFENRQDSFGNLPIEIVYVSKVDEIVRKIFNKKENIVNIAG